MCDCQKNKISGPMNTKNLVNKVLHTAVGVGGAVAAQELGKMVPADTLDPMYTDIAKVVIGGLVVPMVAKGKAAGYIQSFGDGFAIQGSLNLVNNYLMPASSVSGIDNRGYALMGVDNRDYALMGIRGNMVPGASSQPSARGSLVNYAV